MSSSIQVKEAVLITPSEPTPTQVLQLSALDSQLFLRFTIEYLLVFKLRGSFDQNTIKTRVKSALARALVPYYPLAGRVRAKSDGSGLEVLCRAEGAVFIEAVSNNTLSEFDGPPRYVTQWRKLLSSNVADVLKGAPPLVVQLTWLADGGATLGVGLSHCICDGIGSSEFLNSFAELANGKRGLTEFKPKPVWDRHLLDPSPFKTTHTNSVNHSEFNRVPDVSGFLSRFSQERLTPTSVTFDKRRLNELKKLAKSTSRSCELSYSYTSFEVLSAHIWRSWARSLNLPSNQVLKLLFSVNIRNRVKPSLPSGFYGNGFALGCAKTCVKDLTEKGLGYAAEVIRRAKERVNDKYVREVVEMVSSSQASPDSVGVLIVSQWSRMGLERVDFGLGRPMHVGPICCDRYCLMLPVYDERDGVKVMVAVPTSAVGKYEYLMRSINS